MSDIINNADEFYNQDRMLDLFMLMHKHKEENNNLLEDEFLWRLARANYQMAKILFRCKKNKNSWGDVFKKFENIVIEASTSYKFDRSNGLRKGSVIMARSIEQAIEQLYKQGLEFSKAAVAKNSKSSSAHKWLGVMTNCNLAYQSLQGQISISFDIKSQFEKAIELNQNDPTLYYCMGCWHFEISKLSWYAKSLAKLLGPGKSFTSTFEDALNSFLFAEKTQPFFFCDNLYMIANCYKELGKKIEAKQYCDKILKDYPIKTTEDKEVLEKTKELINSI